MFGSAPLIAFPPAVRQITSKDLKTGPYPGMTDLPRRPTLHLKNPPARAQPVVAAVRWKCKPCGTLFEVDPKLADSDPVRCPGCNARLGLAERFRSGSGEVQGIRARIAS